MTKKERARAVTELLREVYPEAICALHYTHDYELLFATRLSASVRTHASILSPKHCSSSFPRWKAMPRLRKRKSREAIKTCGLFRTKARDLKACAIMLLSGI